ncbi:ABC transporter ATP-binding protein [Lachnospiraceae bacterium JLR.KK008]
MDENVTIRVRDLNKVYKLYDKPIDRLKEALGLSRKKKYKEHYALRGVDMEIRQGETVGIIGTNGSGKSTILKIITGVLNPTSGSVEVDGRISALLELGAGFNMEYNGIENIYLNGTMIGFSREEIDAKLDEILAFADIGDYVYQPCKTYSSGMFVRLAFAVAINIDPEILIVDEALSVGDVFFQAKCYHKFEEFKKMGKTILFVSHDLSSVSKYCDRVILLNKGEKLAEGSPKQMIDIYKQVLVGQYTVHEAQEEGTNLLDDEEVSTAARKENAAAAKERTQDGNGKGDSAADTLEYGTRQATITEYYMTDDQGMRTNTVLKGSTFSVHMKVEFADELPAPIFACSIKNALGVEITGTNTMVEKAYLEPAKKGNVKEAVFTQKMNLQGGEYLISLGLTGYEGDRFCVYHRLYDVMNITVISDKNTVGYYDMDSKVTVKDV